MEFQERLGGFFLLAAVSVFGLGSLVWVLTFVFGFGRLVVERFLVLLFRRCGLFVDPVRRMLVLWAIVVGSVGCWFVWFVVGFRVYACMLALLRYCKKQSVH